MDRLAKDRSAVDAFGGQVSAVDRSAVDSFMWIRRLFTDRQ